MLESISMKVRQDITFIHLHESTIERFAAMCNFYSTSFILRGSPAHARHASTGQKPGTRKAGPYLAYAPWHFLYFLPLPQGQGSLRPTFPIAGARVAVAVERLPPR